MADETTTLRRCIGSTRFRIQPHGAPVEDFRRQPSQKDGLGRMCRTHWNEYAAGLARNAKARKAAQVALAAEPEGAAGPVAAPRRPGPVAAPAPGAQGDAG